MDLLDCMIVGELKRKLEERRSPPLMNMASCYALNQRIADVPPARCMNCEDLGSCRAYVLLSKKKGWK